MLQAAGGFPVDLVIFAMIAAFLVLRLRSILGKRTGFEGAPTAAPIPGARKGGVIDGRAEPVRQERPLPDTAGPVGRTMAAMQEADRRFNPAAFLAGAEHAFRLIVEAFAAGDRDRLRPLLTPETFAAFEGVIAAREAASHTQRTDLRSIDEVTITDAHLAGSLATITVRFVSSQVNLTTDKSGEPVSGTDAITEIHDLWGFVRELGQADLTWRLASVRSA
jgi:predicted lipid-binding transport protein (Tim44 family)